MIAGDDNHINIVDIDLAFNNLTRFESSVFQLVLEKFASFGGYPKAYVNIEESKWNNFQVAFYDKLNSGEMSYSIQTQLIVVTAICRG